MPLVPAALRTVFMGSPSFAVPALRALHEAGYAIQLVVTQPDRPAGRGGRPSPPAVKLAAEELGLTVFQPETLKDEGARARIIELRPDIIVVAAYGKILPRAILEAPTRGCLNVHASLLPRWRGASPIAAAILAGDARTGATIMEMVSKMDAGPIVAQREVDIPPDATTGSLEPVLARLGAELLIEVLPGWFDGTLSARPQDEGASTYCWTLSKADGHLRREWDAAQAERGVRAFDPWPGAFVLYRGERLAIWKARVVASGAPEPGSMAVVEGLPAIAFSGGWLLLEEVQRPGARRITGAQFLNGERGKLAPECGLRD